MNKKNAFKQPFGWIFFLILLIFIIFLGARQLKMRKVVQAEQAVGAVLEKEVITPELKAPKKTVEEILEKKTEDKPSSETKGVAESQQKLFTIQVASFQDKARAETAVEDLKKKDYIPVISSKDLGEKGIWYRVYVGDFDSEDEASELLKTLKKEYKDSFIKLR